MGCLAWALGLIGWTNNQQGRTRFVPAGQVVKVGVLTIGIEIEHRLFRCEENGHAAMQRISKRDATRKVVAGGLFFEGLRCREREGNKKEDRCNEPDNLHSAIVARHCARCKMEKAKADS